MPIQFAHDPKLRLIYTRYSGAVGKNDLTASIRGICQAFCGAGDVDAIHLFAAGADLSTLSIDALERIKHEAGNYAASGIIRRKSALIDAGSSDAMIMAPLWRALCKTDPNYATQVETFTNLEDACGWLERDVASVRRLAETLDP